MLNPSDFIGIYNTPKLYMPFASYSAFQLSNKTFLYGILSAGIVMMTLMDMLLPVMSAGMILFFVAMMVISKDGIQSELLLLGFFRYHLNAKKTAAQKTKKKRSKKEETRQGHTITPSGHAMVMTGEQKDAEKSQNTLLHQNMQQHKKETVYLKNDADVMNLTLNVGSAYHGTYVTVYVDDRRMLRDVVDQHGRITVTLQPSAGQRTFDIHPDDKVLPPIRRIINFE